MQMTIGELIDRLTIEQRKAIYGCKRDMIEAIEQDILQRFGNKAGAAIVGAGVLGVLNSSIAVLEWQIREGKNLAIEEVGRRALMIRELNGYRVIAKNKISTAFGEPETPVYFGIGADDLNIEIQKPLS